MKVLVCLKDAVDPQTAEYDVRSDALVERDRVLGPVDFVALEMALRLADDEGAVVTAATVGPSTADAVVRQALTYGADAGIRIWDDRLEGADSFVVARALAAAASKTRADIVLMGTKSIDGASGCVGPTVAEHLGSAFVSNVVTFSRSGDEVVVARAGDAGWRDEFSARFPVVLAVDGGLNIPRYVGVLSRKYRRGLGIKIEVLSTSELDLTVSDLNSLVDTVAVGPSRPRTKAGAKVGGMSMKEKLSVMRGESGKSKSELFTGSPEAAAKVVLERLETWL